MTEADLTQYVREDFELLGYTTYAEVCMFGGGSKRCDMYAIKENKADPEFGRTIVFEAKLSFNLKVIEQAYHWTNKAHYTYVLIPTTHKNVKSRIFARMLCDKLGIGVMEVNVNKGTYYVTVKPKFNPKPKMPKLYEEQKQTVASNSNNEYVTPFKITVKSINEYMENRNESVLIDLVKNIKHHYKSDRSACNSIKNLIEFNVIKNFYITKKNNKIVISKKN